jgi:hypothetical protein
MNTHIELMPTAHGAQFWPFVQNALKRVKVLTCSEPSCPHCAGGEIRELAHFAKCVITEWRKSDNENQLCWSSYVGDNDKALFKITHQYSPYKLLCLIKVYDCPRLSIYHETFKTKLDTYERSAGIPGIPAEVAHFKLNFTVPPVNMVRIELATTGEPGFAKYECVRIL